VVGAALVALMAAFTGMHLTHGLSLLSAEARKPPIVKAAIVLGGGIWSTHFVAMLALDLPVAVFYDARFTLTSALIAILLSGAALLLMHFGRRTNGRVLAAGTIMGLGIVTMHYVGMLGMRGCAPVFVPAGYIISTLLSIGMCVGAIRLAYGRRTRAGLTLGAVLFALAILAMHFTAMHFTGFLDIGTIEPGPALVANEVLALAVVLSAFLICGAFLLTTATLGEAATEPATDSPSAPPEAVPLHAAPLAAGPATAELRRVPYERDGKTYFSSPEEIVAIQAEGHYTRLHREGDQLFCPLAIAKLDAALSGQQFMRTHRSYLVNLRHVRGFERRRDQGLCLFDPKSKVPPVPVSRARVQPMMKALGL
jgi:NO-binding membrane sensor protein with MHYT domain